MQLFGKHFYIQYHLFLLLNNDFSGIRGDELSEHTRFLFFSIQKVAGCKFLYLFTFFPSVFLTMVRGTKKCRFPYSSRKWCRSAVQSDGFGSNPPGVSIIMLVYR